MRISFDLDDTLICYGTNTPSEPGRYPAIFSQWFAEPLRLGAFSLVRELRRRGCSIWIYTTSDRSPFRIQLWLFLHGIRVDGIVNNVRHRRTLARDRFVSPPSKYPPAFGIDLHVDDSQGVRMEGDKFGFRVVVIRPDDEHWTTKVLDALPGRVVD